MKSKLLVVCGPTATGKTDFALKIASKLQGELFSADSRQVYIGMDIGTGKDLPSEVTLMNDLRVDCIYKEKKYEIYPYNINNIPLWLYDIVNPDQEFSVAHFVEIARAGVASCVKRSHLPILVGGTGMYIHAFLHPFTSIEIPPNSSLRAEISGFEVDNLQSLLSRKFPMLWQNLNESDRQNPRRLVRKLEIGEFLRREESRNKIDRLQTKIEYDVMEVGLHASTDFLYDRIDTRVESRVDKGIIQEIELLLQKGYSWELSSMSSMGYRQWRRYFEHTGNLTALKKEITLQWKFDEHAYSRRQMTWFKKNKNIHWYDISNELWQQDVWEDILSWYNRKI